MASSAALRERLRAALPSVRADLEALVAIPSVSLLPEHADDVRRSAGAVADLFEGEGFDLRLVAIGDAAPAVLARKTAPAGSPTALLYAHHNVQPAGDEADWDTPPFIATEPPACTRSAGWNGTAALQRRRRGLDLIYLKREGR